MLALKDSFVGKGGLPSCEEHASAFITTDWLFLGLEKVNYESKVTILLKPLKYLVIKPLTSFNLYTSR